MNVIVDTNIVFSALLSGENKFRDELIFNEDARFYSCRLLIVVLFKHKEKIAKASQLSQKDMRKRYMKF